MGYWGYEATESDSALDYLAKVTKYLEKLWDEATDYGQKMAVVYVLTEAPVVDCTDYRGLKAKAAKYVQDYADLLEGERNAYGESQKEINYLIRLFEKLQSKQGTSLGEKLTDCFGSLELTNHEKRSIERFPKERKEAKADLEKRW